MLVRRQHPQRPAASSCSKPSKIQSGLTRPVRCQVWSRCCSEGARWLTSFDQFDTSQQPAVDVTVKPYGLRRRLPRRLQIRSTSSMPSRSASPDVAKSAGVGLGEGAIGTLGSVGDVRSLLSSGVDYLGNKLGISPETMQAGKQAFASALPGGQAIAAAPTSQQIQSGVEGVTGPFYQPQTVPGEYARTVGQFAPGAVAGPGGIARRAITQTLVPALASETGGQLYKGTELEPAARLIGGVGGALTGPGAIAGARKAVTPFPISAERQAALSTLQSEGVQVPAGMATGSKRLNAMQSQLGGAQQAENIEQMRGPDLRRRRCARLGFYRCDSRGRLTCLNAADDRIGGVFDAVAARNPTIPIPGFGKVADAIAGDYQRLTGSESPLLNELRAGLLRLRYRATFYQATQSEIRRLAQASSQPRVAQRLVRYEACLGCRRARWLAEQGRCGSLEGGSPAMGQPENRRRKAVSGSTRHRGAGIDHAGRAHASRCSRKANWITSVAAVTLPTSLVRAIR